eukprot:Nk52_evm1s977 gene=Nk52_evmTU1s977
MITEILLGLITILLFVAAYERYQLEKKRGCLPGPKFVPPFVGQVWDMIQSPWSFYENQEHYGKLSWTSVAGFFLLYVPDTDLVRTVFNQADSFRLCLTLHAKRILGENNIAFMHGPAHKDLRRKLLPLFTKKALRVYVDIQEKVTREFIGDWLAKHKEESEKMKGAALFEEQMRYHCRDLNCETSLRVFVGPYADTAKRAKLAALYATITEGFLGFPVNLPGFAMYRATQARKAIVKELEEIVEMSKKQISAGKKEECLLDFWTTALFEDKNYDEDVVAETRKHFTTHGMACTLLDFLFASQDASTSSLVWAIELLFKHPDVLARVREEQVRLRPNDEPIADHLEEMTYTKMVVKEILRHRPPAVMVPHEAVESYQLTSNYTVPKGSVLLPSIWCASKQGFSDPHTFDPERFNESRREDVSFAKNYLVFGLGPHRCIGKEYAYNHLEMFVAVFSTLCDWERIPAPKHDEIIYGPTIYPADGCVVRMKGRDYKTASSRSRYEAADAKGMSKKEKEQEETLAPKLLNSHASSMVKTGAC